MELEGKVALVTGAARRLGKVIASELARGGAAIVVHYGSSEEEARSTAAELAGRGVEAWPVQADLGQPDEIEKLFSALDERFDRLDVLVNSAASFVRQSFDRVSAADWDRVLAVNLRAPFLCSQRAARSMRRGGGKGVESGVIVNISDLSGVMPWKGYAQHSVSKAGVIHLTRSAAKELAPDVRVNALAPGAILPPPGMDEDDPDWQRRGSKVPLGRTGDTAHVASAVRFLIENDFINGAVLPVDGGEHLLWGGR